MGASCSLSRLKAPDPVEKVRSAELSEVREQIKNIESSRSLGVKSKPILPTITIDRRGSAPGLLPSIVRPDKKPALHIGDLWVMTRAQSPATRGRKFTLSTPDLFADLPSTKTSLPPTGIRFGRASLDPISDVDRSHISLPEPSITLPNRRASLAPQPVLPDIQPVAPVARLIQSSSKLAQLQEQICCAPAHVRATMGHASRTIQKNYRNHRLRRLLDLSVMQTHLSGPKKVVPAPVVPQLIVTDAPTIQRRRPLKDWAHSDLLITEMLKSESLVPIF